MGIIHSAYLRAILHCADQPRAAEPALVALVCAAFRRHVADVQRDIERTRADMAAVRALPKVPYDAGE